MRFGIEQPLVSNVSRQQSGRPGRQHDAAQDNRKAPPFSGTPDAERFQNSIEREHLIPPVPVIVV
jgi:hypothetical protein